MHLSKVKRLSAIVLSSVVLLCTVIPIGHAAPRTPTTLTESGTLKGDVNGDGVVDVFDATLVKAVVLKKKDKASLKEPQNADMDGKDGITALDYLLIKKKAQDKPTKPNKVSIPWDWAGVIGTGQSLAVGVGTFPNTVKTTTQPYNNLKLSLGSSKVPPFDPNNSSFKMVPLIEPIRSYATNFMSSAYPDNIWGETPHTTMGSQITALVKAASGKDYITAHTEVGESGQVMSVIRKGATDTGSVGRAYAASIFEVKAIDRLAKAAGKTYGVGAIILTHGEADANSSTYENDVHQLWSDYNQDIKAITGQTQSIPLLLTQQNSYEPTGTAPSALAQWKAGLDYPKDIICVGPKYQYSYVNDHIHLTTDSYRLLGEKYGQAYYEKVVLGHDWQPLQPTSVSKSDKVITITFNVPAPPLVWDNTLQTPTITEWKNGKGFEVTASGSKVTISSAEISGNSVKITCANDLPASGIKVGYAFTAGGIARTNGTARWGLLRDSDPFIGDTTKVPQPNYCVAFEMQVP